MGGERELRAQGEERRRRERETPGGRRRALKKAIGKHTTELAGAAGGLATLRGLPGRLSAEVAIQLGPRGAGDPRVARAIGKLTELTDHLAELGSERRQGELADARPSTVRPPSDLRAIRPLPGLDARSAGVAALPQHGTPASLEIDAAGAEQAARLVERELRRRGVGRDDGRAKGAAALVQDAMGRLLRAIDDVVSELPARDASDADRPDAYDRAIEAPLPREARPTTPASPAGANQVAAPSALTLPRVRLDGSGVHASLASPAATDGGAAQQEVVQAGGVRGAMEQVVLTLATGRAVSDGHAESPAQAPRGAARQDPAGPAAGRGDAADRGAHARAPHRAATPTREERLEDRGSSRRAHAPIGEPRGAAPPSNAPPSNAPPSNAPRTNGDHGPPPTRSRADHAQPGAAGSTVGAVRDTAAHPPPRALPAVPSPVAKVLRPAPVALDAPAQASTTTTQPSVTIQAKAESAPAPALERSAGSANASTPRPGRTPAPSSPRPAARATPERRITKATLPTPVTRSAGPRPAAAHAAPMATSPVSAATSATPLSPAPSAPRATLAARPTATLERPTPTSPVAAPSPAPPSLVLAANTPAAAPAGPVIPTVPPAGSAMPEAAHLVPPSVRLDGDRVHASTDLRGAVGQRAQVAPAAAAQRTSQVAPLGPELRRQVPLIESPVRAHVAAFATAETDRTTEHDRATAGHVAQDGATRGAQQVAHAAQLGAAIAVEPRPAQLAASAVERAADLVAHAAPVAPPSAAPSPDADHAISRATHATAQAAHRALDTSRGAALAPRPLPAVALDRGVTAHAAVTSNAAPIESIGAQMRGVPAPAFDVPPSPTVASDPGASAAAEAGVAHPPSRAHAIAGVEHGIAQAAQAQAPAQIQQAGHQLASDYEGQAHADHATAAAQVTQASADAVRAEQEIQARPSPVQAADVETEAHARWSTGQAQATQATQAMHATVAQSQAGARSATTAATGQRTASVTAARTAQTTAVAQEQTRFHASQAQAETQLHASQAQAQRQMAQQQQAARQTAQHQTAQAHAHHDQQVAAAHTSSQAQQTQARAQHDQQVTSAQTASTAQQQQLQTASDQQVEQQHTQLQQRTDQLNAEGHRQVEAHLQQGERGYQTRIQQGQTEAAAKRAQAEAEAARKKAEADAANSQQGGVLGAAINWVRDRVNDLLNAAKAILEAAKAAIIAIMEAARTAAIAILEAARRAAQAALEAIKNQIQAVIKAIADAVRAIIAAAAAAIRAAIQALAETLKALVQALTTLISSLITALQQLVHALLDGLIALVAVFDQELARQLDAATQGFRRAFDHACDTMKHAVEQAGAALQQGIQTAANVATAAVDRAEHALEAAVTSIETQLHAAVEQAYHAASQAIDAAFATAEAAVNAVYDAAEAAVTAYFDAQIAAVAAVQTATNWAFDRAVELADKAMVAISKAAAWVVAQLPDTWIEGFMSFWNGPWRSTILIGLAVLAAVAFTGITGGAGGPLAVMLVAGLVGGTLTGGAYLAGEAVARQGEIHLANNGNGLYVPNYGYVPLGADGKPDLAHVPKDKLQDVDWAMSSFKANGDDRAASGLQMERGPDGKLRPVARSDREIGSLAFSEGVKGFGEGFIAAASAAGGGVFGGMVAKASWLTKVGPVGQRILSPLLSHTVEGVWQVASNSLTGAWDAGFQAMADGRGPLEAFQDAGKAWLHSVTDPGQLGMTLATMVPVGGRFGKLLREEGVGPRLLNTLVETGKMTVGEVGGNFLATYATALHDGAKPADALHRAMAKAEEGLDPTKLAINLVQTHAMGVVHERFVGHETVGDNDASRGTGTHGEPHAPEPRPNERAGEPRASEPRPNERAGEPRASEPRLNERAGEPRASEPRASEPRPAEARAREPASAPRSASEPQAQRGDRTAARDERAVSLPELEAARPASDHVFSEAEVRQMSALREQVRALPELEPAHWERLTPGERHETITRVVDAIHEALGVPEEHRPTVEMRDLPPGQGGWADWPFVDHDGVLAPVEPRGRIVLNENLPVSDALRAALHESRHMFQMHEAWTASRGELAHPRAAEWRANQPSQGGTYHDPAIDHERYRNQPIERDAEGFARRVSDRSPLDAAGRDRARSGLEQEVPARAPRSQDEPVAARSDAPADVQRALVDSRGQLGPELGRGGFGAVHEVPGHPDLVIKVPLGDVGDRPNVQLLREAAALRGLSEAGIQTPYRGTVEWVDGAGVRRTGIVMERIDGAFSKNVLQTGKLAGDEVRPEHRALLNERTIRDLETLRQTCIEQRINIEDLQFMVAPDGSIRVIDPARVEFLADSGLKNRKVRERMEQFQRRIDRTIAATRDIAAQNRRITASAVPGSEFRGGSASPDRVRAQADAHAALRDVEQRFPDRIQRVERVDDGYVVTRTDGSVFSVAIDAQALGAHTNAHTRVRPTGEGRALRDGARVDAATDVHGHYVIEVSDTLEPHQVQRAIDHELAEVIALQNAERSGLPVELDSLHPGPVAPDARLSPHDEGRVAELNAVVRQLDGSPASQRELQALIEHLGLREGSPGADQRRALIERSLSPEARAVVDELRRPTEQLAPEHRATVDDVRARAAADADPRDPMAPYHALPRELRARPPEPILHDGVPHDVMGVSSDGQLLLRDARAPQRDVRIESLPGRSVEYRGERWQIREVAMSTDASRARIELVDPREPTRRITVTDDVAQVQLVDADGQRFQLGGERHGIVRMTSLASREPVRRPLQPGERFEARLRGRELEGVYQIEVGPDGTLIATGHDRAGGPVHEPVTGSDIAPRYEQVRSSDYRGDFDVDAFAVREDAQRGRPTAPGEPTRVRPVEDPLLGSLEAPGDPRVAVGGVEQLDTFEDFIRRQLEAPGPHESPRKLTLFNISMSTEGHALRILDAMVEFRRRNPDADMRMVVYALGKPEFQGTPEYRHLIETLQEHRIAVDQFRGDDTGTRQVIHAKGILIDDHVLFSTGAVIDAHPKNKADVNLELPPEAAASFRRYTEEAIEGRATPARRQQLAEELARHGILVNDPVAGLPYIARAHDALILGARHDLIVMVSELQDPRVTRTIIARAAEGVRVTVQHRGLDAESEALLAEAQARYPDLRVEGVDGWDPRPHFNLIIADRQQAYVGSAYLWPTQRNMIHHGRSLENGVLLEGAPVAALIDQLGDLDHRARGQAPSTDTHPQPGYTRPAP